MAEKNSFEKGGESMVEKDLVDKARSILVKELEEVLQKSKPNWINREYCSQLVEKIKNKEPVRIGGPFYGDYLDGVLFDLGFRPRDESGLYEAIWDALEKGE